MSNADALDTLMAIAAPSEGGRVLLEPGVTYWRSEGATPADGFRYASMLPAGIHVGAGRAIMSSVIEGTRIIFKGLSLTSFLLREPTPCVTEMAAGTKWTSLGLWVQPDSDLATALAHRLSSLPNPVLPPASVLPLITGAGTSRYRGLAHNGPCVPKAMPCLRPAPSHHLSKH